MLAKWYQYNNVIKINCHQYYINDPSIHYQNSLMKLSQISYFFSSLPRILTGLQPTGDLTLGNYLGSICNFDHIKKQHPSSQKFIFIADLHSLTTAFDLQHAQIIYDNSIGKSTFTLAKTIMSCGVTNDPNTILFVQSQIKQHAQLCWLLECMTPKHWLNMMIQYKQKSSQTSSLGIYSYPVLMASDILLYKVEYVPVGEDQKQHLELTRKYAQRINGIFNREVFPIPNYIVAKTPKIMSLVDPLKKMSKSDKNQRSRINLNDTKDAIAQKIRRSVTDSQGHFISYNPQHRPGLSNLIRIYSSLKRVSNEQVIIQFSGKGVKDFKYELIELIWTRLFEIQRNSSQLTDAEVNKKLKDGAEYAQPIAQQTIAQLKQLLHLYK